MSGASIPTGTTRAASAVWEAKDTILRQWDERVRDRAALRARKDAPMLKTIVPPFLDTLAEALAVPGPEVHFPATLAVPLRTVVAGAPLADIVLEWGALREVLFETLETERPLPLEGRLLLHRLVDEGIHATAAEFSQVRAAEVAETRRLQHAVEFAPVFMALLDTTGKVLDVNDRALRSAGTTREAELGKPFWESTWWQHLPVAAAQVKEAVATATSGHSLRYDTHYWSVRHGTGESRWGDFTFQPLFSLDGRVSTIVVSGIDVTDRYRLLEETRLRANNYLSGAVFAVADAQLRLSFLNEAGRALLGLPTSGPLQLTPIADLLEDRGARLDGEVLPALQHQDRWEGELRFRSKAGADPIDTLCCVFAVREPGTGALTSFAFVAHDLRERKHSDHALAVEHRNFEHLFQESPHLVATLRGPEHVFESLNPAYVRLLRKDATGMSFREAQPEAEDSGLFTLLDRVYKSGETVRSREHPMQVPGRLGYFNFIIAARRNWEEQIDGVTILATDITEVVRARKVAESSQRELRDFIAQFPSPMCLLQGPELVLTLVNDAFSELWARDEGPPLLGRCLRDATPELGRLCPLDLAEQVYRTGEPVRLLERSIPGHGSGSSAELRWVNLLLHPKRNERGQIDGVIAAVTDVTEHVLARRKVQENEARFRLLAEMLPQVIWETSASGELMYSNAYWSSFRSEPGKAVADREQIPADEGDWLEPVEPDDRSRLRRTWRDATAKASHFELELRLRRASDGDYRWFLVRGHPVRDSEGHVLKWLVAATDIHSHKEATAWSDAMVDALPNPLWLLEPGTARILYKSRVASEMEWYRVPAGVAPDQWRDVYPLTDEEDRPLPIDQYPAYRAAQGDFSQREAVWHSPKGRISFLSRAAMVPACFGRPATVAFMIQDVTDLKRTEHELRAALTARDQFLSIASHELKTPLTSLRLLIQSAKRRFTNSRDGWFTQERLLGFVEQTDRSVHRLMRLVDDMLDASRISSGQLSYHAEKVDLGQLVEEVVERFTPQAENLRVPIHVRQSTSIEGQWDRLRLDQVITNLITNALRYGARSPVEVSVGQEKSEAVLVVADSGPGIPPEHRERIFQRFERLPAENSAPGLGLGLFICREIVEHYGGRITAESPAEGGARFVVRLPLAGSSSHA